MAEIKIEKKKPIWPWALMILFVLAIVAYFIYDNQEHIDDSDDVSSKVLDERNSIYNKDSVYSEITKPYQDSINVMNEFSNSIKDSTRIGMDSTHTKTALRNLSKVVVMKAYQYNLESSNALENLKLYSESSELDSVPKETGISNNFKNIGTDIVLVLETIQTKNFPTLQKDVADLKQKLVKVNSNSAIEKQKTTIQSFFKKVNEVLNKMNT